MPEKCFKCSTEIIPSNPTIKFNGNIYHADCLKCTLCNKNLSGVKFVREKNGLVCVQCEEEHGLKCFKCKKGFQPGQSYKRFGDDNKGVDEKCFHPDCFTCAVCNTSIPGEFYDRKGEAVCVECHRKKEVENTKYCNICQQVIKGKFLIYKEKPHHADCFKCCICTLPITAKSFYKIDDTVEPVCDPCHQAHVNKTAKICAKCQQPILTVGVEFENMFLHDTCLKCSSCETILSGPIITNADREVFCDQCYKTKYARKCEKCQQLINPTTSCAIFEEKTFHRECFTCDQCGQSIAELQFIKKDDKFICLDCK